MTLLPVRRCRLSSATLRPLLVILAQTIDLSYVICTFYDNGSTVLVSFPRYSTTELAPALNMVVKICHKLGSSVNNKQTNNQSFSGMRLSFRPAVEEVFLCFAAAPLDAGRGVEIHRRKTASHPDTQEAVRGDQDFPRDVMRSPTPADER